MSDRACCCCGHRIIPPAVDSWEGRMDDYCVECRWTRCDAYPDGCTRYTPPEVPSE